MIVRLAKSHRLTHALSTLAMAGALTLALGALAPSAQAAPVAKGDAGAVTLDITQPTATSSGYAEGPVGANLFIQGHATAGDTIQLGVASRSDGCATGFRQLNGVSATAASDGSFTASFAWPQIAAVVGAHYYVCAQDTTANAIGSSQTLFQVDSADVPTITLQEVNDPNAPAPGAGTPTPTTPNPPDGAFYTGGFVDVKGQNFTPGNTQVQILLTQGQLTPTTASTPPLQVVSGNAVTSRSGDFHVVVQMPSGQTGQFVLSATSSDGTSSGPNAVLPTLVGSKLIQLGLAPTPTPIPTATTAGVTPTVSNNNGGGGPSGPGTGKIVGAIALGLFSAIFFILGVAMLISASGMSSGPGAGPSGPGGPGGPASGAGRPQMR